MTMLPVTSSLMTHIGYDVDSLTLFVQYHPSKKQKEAGVAGDLWAYKPVIEERWAEAESVLADPEGSIGKWFLANIKGKYEGEMVVPDTFRCTKCGHPDTIHATDGRCPIVNMETMEITGYVSAEVEEW